MTALHTDVVILGGGMVGLCIAHQLIERNITKKITILDKEKKVGEHSSGRNSGVLHAGLYYKPGTLKAKVCVEGAKRLKQWIKEKKLSINNCGKIIVPTKVELDSQLDLLAERGRANGAKVELWDSDQLSELIPEARTSSGRALWSPETAVVKPLKVIEELRNDLENKGVQFMFNEKNYLFEPESKKIILSNGSTLNYRHLFNCTGLQADRIAHKFGIGKEYTLIPFRGLYWQLKKNCTIKLRTNLYPVPDLNVPFLGIHFTPSADCQATVSIGPTATPAWGRENYRGLKGIETSMAASNIGILARQYLNNRGRFREYVHQQAFLAMTPLLIKAAQELIPKIKRNDIELSQKVGIRSQLFNRITETLEDDFLCVAGPHSTHVLNAISPAFTASFALADLILDESQHTGCIV
tara:strand:- start:1730 stop:2962 length:1233 start_codon:yes stop_codon:yes gene_type:complete